MVGKVVNAITDLGPLEAMSALQILTGNAVAEDLIDIKSAMALQSGHHPRPPFPPFPGPQPLRPGDPGYSQLTPVAANQTNGVFMAAPNEVKVVGADGSITDITVTET